MESNVSGIVRLANGNDIKDITEIYNEAIRTTTATFDTQAKTIHEQQTWFEQHHDKLPICVYELNQQVVGWVSLSAWSDRCAYDGTAEISLYVKEQYRGRGIGKALLSHILNLGQQAGLHTIIARITEGNEKSIKMHKAFEFKTIGTMREVGRKFGLLLDVTLMQKIFS